MNVNQHFPSVEEVRSLKAADLLILRGHTFYGYCHIETQNGGIDPSISLSLPRGQDQVRLLFARTVEEILEAYHSEERTHFLEELIDAINFATSLLFLVDFHREEVQDQACSLLDHALEVAKYGTRDRLHIPEMLMQTTRAMHPLLESLRNRSWMNHSQHPYFQGHRDLLDAVYMVWLNVLPFFESSDHFRQFYVAKDRVLQFRLATKY